MRWQWANRRSSGVRRDGLSPNYGETGADSAPVFALEKYFNGDELTVVIDLLYNFSRYMEPFPKLTLVLNPLVN